ncbi:hypothetical protein HED60_20780 [Planctomycetales bacterium ZRK34]|nr:hypothetical protein HED60_20780 [Planctomycetales bacterium ZRK34]
MLSKNTMLAAATFFCLFGWVCNGQAIEETAGEAPMTPVVSETPVDAAPEAVINETTETREDPATEEPVDAPATTGNEAEVAEPTPAKPMSNPSDLIKAAADAISSFSEEDKAPVEPAADQLPSGPVQVSKYDTVSLNVQNTDLANVLQLLSIQGKRNIVPSPKVAGTVTANLYDVTFHEALDAILQQNGAGYIEKGNFIFVYTFDELQKIKDAERKVAHQIFKLNYITAQDASTFITPLLSAAGSIAISGQVAAGFEPSLGDGGANSFSHTETMIVRDYPDHLEEVAKVIKQIDTRPEQVLVESTILQANLTEDMAYGVDVSILADMGLETATGAGALGSVLDTVTNMISGDITKTASSAINTSIGNQSGDAGVRVGVLTNNVQVFVRALDRVTDTTILANPKIMTLNRQRAQVLVGEKVAYLSTTATSTATTQTVEFLDTGTQLTLRPFVSNDGMIRLELKPQISSAELRDAGAGSSVVTLPDETTQELTTNVMVPDGQTIVLGGLFKEETTIGRNQIPGLGDMPLIGPAFRGVDNIVNRSEVIFLITPHIVKDKALAAAGDAALDGIEMARIGAREGLLPWSRSKLTASHVRDALNYLEENNKDKALYEVDMALSLDPNSIEARRLKEKLTGERAYWPGRNLLDDTVDIMVDRQAARSTTHDGVPVKPDPQPAYPKPTVPVSHAEAMPGLREPVETKTASADDTTTVITEEAEAAEPATAGVDTNSVDSPAGP